MHNTLLTLLEELPLTSCLLSTSGRLDHFFLTCITEEITKKKQKLVKYLAGTFDAECVQ